MTQAAAASPGARLAGPKEDLTASGVAQPLRWREVGAYLAVVFGITWGIAAVALGAPHWFEATFGKITAASPAFYLAVWAPDIAAVSLTLAFAGPQGLKALLARLSPTRGGAVWWLIAAGFYPALLLVLQLVGPVFGRPAAPLSAWGAYAAATITPLVLTLGATGEELGWRGFLLPRLLGRFHPLAAALILGAIWMVWHIPAFLVASLPQASLSFPVFVLNGLVLSLYMTWIFRHTRGSILLAGVIPHIAMNATNPALADLSPQHGVVLAAGAVLLVLLAGPRLARPQIT